MSVTHSGRVLVSGANGFVGRALVAALLRDGRDVTAAVRSAAQLPVGAAAGNPRWVAVGDIGPETDWGSALAGIETVVHLAARVHVMRTEATDATAAAFAHVNLHGSACLARAAAAAGVRRLVYLSSAKVHGEATPPGRRYSESDPPQPQDPYALSKWQAEQSLQRIAADSGLGLVVLRPPLVYGPGVGANFLRLLKLLDLGLPLPLASIDNRRSMLYVDNLVAAIAASLAHPQAAGQTFLVSDGIDLSTPELLRRLAQALGRKARLWPCPVAVLRRAAALAGKGEELRRLTDSLALSSDKLANVLGWRSPYAVGDGLAATAAWYREMREA